MKTRPKMMNRRRWGIFWAMIGMIILLIVLFSPREHSLLSRAKQVAAFPDFQPPYYWTSDRELVYFHRLSVPHFGMVRKDILDKNEDFSVVGVNGLLNAQTKYGIPQSLDISPDGRWILWYRSLGTRYADGQTWAARLDGSRYIHWRGGNEIIRWLGDSRHFATFLFHNDGPGQALIHDVDQPAIAQTLPIQGVTGWMPTAFPLIHLTTDDHILYYPPMQHNKVVVVDIPLKAGGQLGRTYTIALPYDSIVKQVGFSPHRGQIAFLLNARPYVSPLRIWLSRLFPQLKDRSMYTTGIWVSRLDGSDLHEVGHIDIPIEEKSPDASGAIYLSPIMEIEWLPSSKQLSFYYQGALWTIPAD